jgi:hypothetical protein
MSVNKDIKILIEIVLNPFIALGSMAIYTIPNCCRNWGTHCIYKLLSDGMGTPEVIIWGTVTLMMPVICCLLEQLISYAVWKSHSWKLNCEWQQLAEYVSMSFSRRYWDFYVLTCFLPWSQGMKPSEVFARLFTTATFSVVYMNICVTGRLCSRFVN